MKIKLPANPVDGYTLEFWQVYLGLSTHLDKVRYKYYKNTSWATYVDTDGGGYYSQNEKDRGSPLIDQWMVSSFYPETGHWHPVGRFDGWDIKQKLEERKDSAGLDEIPFGYKDILKVMAAQDQLVEVLGQFDPKLVKMAPGTERAED